MSVLYGLTALTQSRKFSGHTKTGYARILFIEN